MNEFCDWESFNETCRKNEVLIIHTARYGRMKLGRCVVKNYGHIGCGTDVTSEFDRLCSGRHHCLISVISLHGLMTSCPPDLKAYVEVSFECVKGEVTEVIFSKMGNNN